MLAAVACETRFRIGELSRRSGVSPELLRAWERRYGLLRPGRSAGGLRLYSEDDLRRVRTMQEQIASGLAAAEAAAVASARDGGTAVTTGLEEARAELAEALSSFDEARAHAIVDRLVAHVSLDALLGEVVVPYLHELGERWERGEVSVAQEHFASALLRGRLLGLARGWGQGLGPIALLACAPGEQHDLGLIVFGLALRARGFRVVFLGADTPLESVADVARSSRAACVVVSAVDPEKLDARRAALVALAAEQALAVGGAGAARVDLGDDVIVLAAGPVEEAERLARLVYGRSASRDGA